MEWPEVDPFVLKENRGWTAVTRVGKQCLLFFPCYKLQSLAQAWIAYEMMISWLRLQAWAQVPSLVTELKSQMLYNVARKKKMMMIS